MVQLVWSLSAVVAYRNGSWKPVEMRQDNSGYSSYGPDITRHPEIYDLLTSMGMYPTDPVPNEAIQKLSYRFSATYAPNGAACINRCIKVVGDTDTVDVIANELASVRNALLDDETFVTVFHLGPAPIPPEPPEPPVPDEFGLRFNSVSNSMYIGAV